MNIQTAGYNGAHIVAAVMIFILKDPNIFLHFFLSAILDNPMVIVYLGAFAIGISLIGLLVKRMISNI